MNPPFILNDVAADAILCGFLFVVTLKIILPCAYYFLWRKNHD